jgi:hypothetical protein
MLKYEQGDSSMKIQLLALIATFVLPLAAGAANKGDWRIGLQAGEVLLMGDVSATDENSIGFGGTAGIFVSDDFVFEADLINSSHTSVKHSALSVGGNWYLGDYQSAYPSLAAGVSFISNEIKSIGATGDGFGAYFGGGFDFELSPLFSAGIQLRYQKAFEGKTRINNVDYVTVDDSATVLLRLMYYFGEQE